jgi:hypothetical protein
MMMIQVWYVGWYYELGFIVFGGFAGVVAGLPPAGGLPLEGVDVSQPVVRMIALKRAIRVRIRPMFG